MAQEDLQTGVKENLALPGTTVRRHQNKRALHVRYAEEDTANGSPESAEQHRQMADFHAERLRILGY